MVKEPLVSGVMLLATESSPFRIAGEMCTCKHVRTGKSSWLIADGARDGTSEIIKRLTNVDTRIRLVRYEHNRDFLCSPRH